MEILNARTTPEGQWVLNMGMADPHYQLSEETNHDKRELTLSWTRVDPHRFARRPLVVIDPGHGGSDPGALGPGGSNEKTDCLELALALQHALWQHRVNAVLTRSTDAELWLAPRLDMIEQLKADAFVSLHANSHTTPDSTGIETYWREPASQAFAEQVQKDLAAALKRPDRGTKQERLYVLRNPEVPSLLLETGFISNPAEERMLADHSFQSQAAAAIANSLAAYLTKPHTQANSTDAAISSLPQAHAPHAGER
jgi:N-acetylmuramoyl-L-alanine amidase